MPRCSSTRAASLVLLLGACACSDGGGAAGGDAPPPVEDDSVSPWVTIARQDQSSRTDTPAAFRVHGDEVRVVAAAGPSTSEFRPAVLVANLLDAESTLPFATVRVESTAIDSLRADTAVIRVPGPALQLFVPIRTNLGEWSVEIQQRRSPDDPR